MSLKPGKIKKLDEVVVNRIAAGEIIQRPANALKELIENCLDAQANQITITAKDGGMKLLQIQDNGTGINKEDLGIVAERFTTSKITDFEDLRTISTFGFRGEALASISHVAHLTITTKTANEKCAYKAAYCDGKLKGTPAPCAGNQGTIITVENLFYNVSTRRKALCNSLEEFSKIKDVAKKYAIHNANVGFVLKKHNDHGTEFRTPPRSTKIDNIRIIYGNEVAREILDIELQDSSYKFKLNALVTHPNYQSKKLTFLLFINNRLVESSPCKKVIEDMYLPYVPKKSHPWVYISLFIEPRNIDVNVHPTKQEVRFCHEDAILEKVRNAIDEKLREANDTRTFYIQTELPKTNFDLNELQDILPDDADAKKSYPKDFIRVSADDQKLDKFKFTVNKSMNESKEIKSTTTTKKIEKNHNENKNDFSMNAPKLNQIEDNDKNVSEIREKKIEENNLNTNERLEKIVVPKINGENISENNDENNMEIDSNNKSNICQDQALDLDSLNEDFVDQEMLIQEDTITEERQMEDNEQEPINDTEDNEQELINDTEDNSEIGSKKPHKFKSYSINEFHVETKLLSVLEMRKEVEDNYHDGLRYILSKLIFVGCVDETSAFIQSGANLYFCETVKLVEELFYQIMLYDFANYGVIKFSDPLPIKELALLGLDCEEAGWTEKEGDKDELATRVQELLLEKADMLRQYFSIYIDKHGNLKSLPLLIDNYFPDPAEIPLYILRLSTEVNWSKEKPCFHDICRETARLYSRIDPDNDKWREITENILYNAIKDTLLPPKSFTLDETVFQVTSLPDLYKVFERC